MGEAREIVIYEEDVFTQGLLREWLEGAGFGVRVGNRCDPRIDVPCDLVIVSVYMPKQAGAECTRDIRAAHEGTPLIAISCQFRPGVRAAGSAARMLDVEQVVAKPLVRRELLEAVRAIIAG
jgi:DNA-binding response OmpR family regulator